MLHVSDILWEHAFLRGNMAYEGSWFTAYHPAAVDAPARRYQFWEHGHDHNGYPTNHAQLANRPRVELQPPFQQMVSELRDILYTDGELPENLMRRTILWNRIVAMKWTERQQMVEYIKTTSMRDPFTPFPLLNERPTVVQTDNGPVMVKTYRRTNDKLTVFSEVKRQHATYTRLSSISFHPTATPQEIQERIQEHAETVTELWMTQPSGG